jgi:hypothetical protein
MSAKIRALVGCIVFGLVSACQAPGQQEEVTLQTEDEKTIYAMGLTLALNLWNFNLSEQELVILKQGLTDGVMKNEPKVEVNAQSRA